MKMKISPVKNYKRPEYAIKLAALLTATASLSGCVEGGLQTSGAAATFESDRAGAGAPACTEASAADTTTAAATMSKSTTTTTTEMTTPFSSIEEAELAGDVAVINETMQTKDDPALFTAVAVTATTTAAVATTVTSTTTPAPTEVEITEDFMLEGEPAVDEDEYDSLDPVGIVPAYTDDDCQLAGDVPEPVDTDDEIIELEGDVAAPEVDFEEEIPDDYILANRYENSLNDGCTEVFKDTDISCQIERIDGDEPNDKFYIMKDGSSVINARYLLTSENSKSSIYITFAEKGTNAYKALDLQKNEKLADHVYMRGMELNGQKVKVVIIVFDSFEFAYNYAYNIETPDVCVEMFKALITEGLV